GIQTLLQLFALDESGAQYLPVLPLVSISDKPAFSHRGLLLDCCRHFMDKEFVMRYIDLLAFHKMNVLHWHLTEDQGWRIEIKKYPQLTTTGAWRTETDGSRYGGFYTQEEIKDVVAYASERHITIIPEIELPGHSSAAIASYPWLSCTQKAIPVETEWGVFKDVYCAGNDSTIQFLKDVLTEVITLFPSEYIHIGGDEAPKFRWENCQKCQHRIQTMGLGDEHELQSWFIEEIGKFLEDNGRKLIGWDEILEGGLPEGAAVQSWRGMQGGIHAAESDHFVVMSPTSHCYFDYGLESTDMEEVYGFDPIPINLSAEKHHFILGGECNMWTERAPQETIDSKVFPRILALSEVLWTYPSNRNYAEFRTRARHHYQRLDLLGVNYGFETVPLEFTTSPSQNGISLEARPLIDKLDIRFREIGDTVWQDYASPLIVEAESHVEFQISRQGKVYPKSIESHLSNHWGMNADFSLDHTYSDYYTGGGDTALLDGVLGSIDFRDGHWQALQSGEINITVDLGEIKKPDALYSNFLQYNNAWIFMPRKVEFYASYDSLSWRVVDKLLSPIARTEKQIIIHRFEASDPGEGRYFKMVAKNGGPNPDWHDSPGLESWLFCDEFVIRGPNVSSP
ncbi:MAG: family 20 glycosylhydrolase, partial [Flavobacteriales bacterium]|nr:family 20 glycosylhydrolase [Flavobacteriales bacterium]